MATLNLYDKSQLNSLLTPSSYGPGFELTGAFPVSRDRDHLRLVELDCLLCRATPP
jgi:hypothetical protein